MSVAILFVIVFALAALHVPIAISMLAGVLVFMFLDGGLPISIVAQRMAPSLESFPLLAVPLFILAGNLLNHSGIAPRIFTFAETMVGHIRGSLAHVNVTASVIFSGMSGVAQADAAGLGTIEIRAMRKAGFTGAFSAAITAASAVIGPIIPPSVIMVIYAVLAGVSVADLFLAGIVPGLLLAGALMVTVFALSFKTGANMPKRPRAALRDVVLAFVSALPGLLAPAILLAGLLGGFATPTELGAIIVVYALILGLAYRELSLDTVLLSLRSTVVTCGALLIIVAAAAPFAWLIAVKGVPAELASALMNVSERPWVILLVLNAGLLLAGCFMETTAILIISVPALFPLIQALGIDPVHFGVMLVFNLLIGTVTPPFGVILFIMMDIAKVRLADLVRALLPFYVPLFVVLALITFVPAVTLWLPEQVTTFFENRGR